MGQGASSQLFHAAATGDLDLLKQLSDRGVDVNSVEEVMYTSSCGHPKFLVLWSSEILDYRDQECAFDAGQ